MQSLAQAPQHSVAHASEMLESKTRTPVTQERHLSEVDARRIVEMATLYHERKSGTIDRVVGVQDNLELNVLRTALSDIGIDQESIERAVVDYAPNEKRFFETFEALGGVYDTKTGQEKYANVILAKLRELYPIEEFRSAKMFDKSYNAALDYDISLAQKWEENASSTVVGYTFFIVKRSKEIIMERPGIIKRLCGEKPTPVQKERVTHHRIGTLQIFWSSTSIDVYHAQFAQAIQETQTQLVKYEKTGADARRKEITYHC